MKYKLWDTQNNEYRTTYDENDNSIDEVFDNIEEIEEILWNFHSIDYGGLEKEEFNELTLSGMLMLFDWEIHYDYCKC